MKKLLLIWAMLGIVITTQAQLSFEHTYNHTYVISGCDLDDDGFKYVAYDTIANDIKVYNLNHSLWKTVSINLPDSAKFSGQLQWVSKKLFNSDNNIEFSLTYYRAINGRLIYGTRIYNEQGHILHSLDNVNYTSLLNMGGQYKLIANKQDGYTKDVYGLPGTYNNGSLDMKPTTNEQPGLFPNPVHTVAKLSYSLPANAHSGQINIYNAAGILVRKMPIGRAFDHILISRDDLPAGNYIYEITAHNYRSPSSKFTIL